VPCVWLTQDEQLWLELQLTADGQLFQEMQASTLAVEDGNI
jgi:hypothetical protein